MARLCRKVKGKTMETKKLSKEQVNQNLSAALKSGSLSKGEKSTEISAEQLDKVTGGVGAWAFEDGGVMYCVYCNKMETTNASFEHHLIIDYACQYASEGATNCFTCKHMYIANIGVKVE